MRKERQKTCEAGKGKDMIGNLWSWRSLRSCVFCLLVFCLPAKGDDRFPPYDNTAEVEANWKAHPDIYQFKTAADIPADLEWQTGNDYPDLGDPAAKKGGTFHMEEPDFPPTLRFIGPDGSNTFRDQYHDNVTMTLVTKHPNLDKWIPCLADTWAVGKDHKTVYFRLNPEATYSTGEKVAVEDFFMFIYVALSPNTKDPFLINQIPKDIASITKYDDHTLSITARDLNPDPVLTVSGSIGAPGIIPFPRSFMREFTDDFPARYQWRKMPTTGAYDIKPEDIKFGRSITMHRVKNWWARDRKYYRYRFNADAIEYRTIPSMDTAFELLRQGKFDYFTPRAIAMPPVYWNDKAEIPELLNGYIERYTFYNTFPRPPRCIYINESKPLLDNVEVRRGIGQACNFDKVIQVVLRGDSVRLQSAFSGYGRFTDPSLRAPVFDINAAQEHFAKAGFTKRNGKGVLVNDKGQPLSFTFTVGSTPLYSQMALILKEDAIKAGLELKIEVLDFTQLFKKGDQKTHELILANFGSVPPYPVFWDFFHTDNAWEKLPDGKRKPKTNTNNFTMTSDPALDAVIDKERVAPDEDTLQKLCWQLEQMIQDRACMVPTWETPYYSNFVWRWVRWPKEGNLKITRMATDAYVYWIDEDIKAETLKAMKEGKSFGEVSHVYDQYRQP
ncbi:MAG: ABC-type dipeptide transport system, periplasmic component [Verrucomicrobiaceae bacterium]|nr:ABC-type dipeptide transport system, periplasmic component [Verrucomicrobiaceae bacterium]